MWIIDGKVAVQSGTLNEQGPYGNDSSFSSDAKSTSTDLYEGGSYAGGYYAMASVTYNQATGETVTANQTTQLTAISTQSGTTAPTTEQFVFALGSFVWVVIRAVPQPLQQARGSIRHVVLRARSVITPRCEIIVA